VIRAFETGNGMSQILNWIDGQPGHDGGFGRIFGGHQQTGLATRARLHRDLQNSFDWTNCSGESEFADEHVAVEIVAIHLLSRGDNSDRNWQIKTRAFFANVSGREVNGAASEWRFETGIKKRRADSISRFFHRCVREPNNDRNGLTKTCVDFDLDGISINAVHSGGPHFGEHGKSFPDPSRKRKILVFVARSFVESFGGFQLQLRATRAQYAPIHPRLDRYCRYSADLFCARVSRRATIWKIDGGFFRVWAKRAVVAGGAFHGGDHVFE
jgi:hypothetical protein